MESNDEDYESIAAELWWCVYDNIDDTPREILDALRAAHERGWDEAVVEASRLASDYDEVAGKVVLVLKGEGSAS